MLPVFTRLDGALHYTFGGGKSRLAFNVENIFDKRYFPTADANNNISPGAPRMARLTLTTAFQARSGAGHPQHTSEEALGVGQRELA